MNRQDLIDIGFHELPHETITNSLNYQLPRGRYLTIGCISTPNEMLCIAQKSKDSVVPSDLIVLHNYDYDGGCITLERIKDIIYGLTGKRVKEKEVEKIKCYEVHRPNIPQYGCTTQCNACKEIESKKG